MRTTSEPTKADTKAESNARKLLTPELRRKVENRLWELLALAKKLWPEKCAHLDSIPEVRYDIKNRFGGVAITGGRDDYVIRLNLILCYENEEHFLKQTVGHEFAHLINHIVNGRTKTVIEKGQPKVKKIRSHGPEWRDVMVKFELEPARTHTYDTSSIETKKRHRSKKGASMTPSQIMDMMKRLQTGFKRLPRESQHEFLEIADTIMNGEETDDE